jgi:ankyrin repeat protein
MEAIARLVAGGADVNARDEHGSTPLKYASAERVPAAIRKLIELGADVNLGDDSGFTPLHCAAGHGFYAEAVEVVEALLAGGADVNARSREFGFVPLHEARGGGVIRLLVARGADAGVRSSAGLTPLEYMIEDGRWDDAEHLRKSLRSGCPL